MKRLLIVESPTKARTIGRMLGDDYKILASMGHVRDLPEHTLGVDIEHDFAPMYVESARSAAIVKELRAAAAKADEIYLAPDPDREGEAIAWHLYELLKRGNKDKFHRVTFHEITRSAIERALVERGEIDMHRVDAQQARRVLDRLVGFQVSQLLWSKLERGISAGRVQSVALRLVVEREQAIQSFKPEEYWVFSLVFKLDSGEEFTTRLFKIDGRDFKVPDEKSAGALLGDVLAGNGFHVAKIDRADKRRYAPPPFTTSTLQQAASNLLHYSAGNTMRYAQQLYEGVELGESGSTGLITYMRTDSVNIAAEAQAACLSFIRTTYGDAYAPAKPNHYKSKASAQEAHEAIRPTDVTRTPESIARYLDAAQLKVYTLIWRRFVASQMTPAVQNLTTVDVATTGRDGREYTFRANATVPVFAGFRKVFDEDRAKEGAEEAAAVLGKLAPEQLLTAAGAEKEQKFTDPPPRYTEASLIKELEENGIGRPSTYATILNTIVTRKYVGKEEGKLVPTELGFKVTEFLVGHLDDLFAVNFTSEMESELDAVEEGKLGWTAMLKKFYEQFCKWLETARAADAPPAEPVKFLIDAMANVQWAPPEKGARRVYDDGKFYRSVKKQFEDGKKPLSARQYQALIRLAAKYREQLPELGEAAQKLNFAAPLADAASERDARLEKQAAQTPGTGDVERYKAIFALFDGLEFDPPTTRRNRTYDDGKFIASLRDQALGGKTLSDKQLAALKRIGAHYLEKFPDQEKARELLAIGAEEEQSAEKAEAMSEAVALLKELGKVTTWAEPVKRGRFTYDDKTFYGSLSKQAAQGKALSDRQLAALKKLAVKYLHETPPMP